MNRRTAFATSALLLAGGLVTVAPAYAQETAARLRGTVDSVSSDQVNLTLRNGSKTTATLPAETRYTWLTVSKLSEIQPGSFIGTVATPQADGTLKAMEVQIFPPNFGNRDGGHFDWDTGNQSSMTNGTVGNLTVANGRTMTLTYKGGEKKVFVPDDVPAVTYEPADKSALTPGAHVLINGTRSADGKVTARNVSIGKDGLVPPM
ncbi:MAG TPA: DUF5666 domain-containing protein [Roseomonas sp.]|nr:DUF5666 domain-containing protein [Roseomonas sp.]